MITLPVWWLAFGDSPARGYWDQQIVEDLLDGTVWDHPWTVAHHVGADQVPDGGAVVVIPGRSQVEHVASINEAIRGLPWAFVIITGDEEHVFPWRALVHPRMRVWVQSPDHRTDSGADGYLPVGWSPPVAKRLLERGAPLDQHRDLAWAFLGQVTHRRRRECVHHLASYGHRGGSFVLNETAGFLQGVAPDRYVEELGRARVAPCPSGPVTVDTFRVCEALQLGCVPLADSRPPDSPSHEDYWPFVFGERPPFPVVDYWAEVGGHLNVYASMYAWRQAALETRAWWSRAKARWSMDLGRQVRDLAGIPDRPDDLITVVISVSPIEAHPSSEQLLRTIASVRNHLPAAPILLACDGVRPEQEHLRDRYLEHLLARLAHPTSNTYVYVGSTWQHQAGTVRDAFAHVRTPLVLFMEHDTPLADLPIDWPGISRVVFNGAAHLVRFHHEAEVHPEHRWLMVDLERRVLDGVPLLGTMQWSQRPHVADAGWYRKLLSTYFGRASRTMIEDVMHGVLHVAWVEHGRSAHPSWRTFIYAPDGTMMRSLHTDGRGDAPKWDMIYEYDGEPPEGAPYPTSRRAD